MFWETSLSIEVLNDFCWSLWSMKSLYLSPYGPSWENRGSPLPSWDAPIRIFCRVTTRFIATSAATKRIKFWVHLGAEFHFENTPKIYKAAFLGVFPKLKPWNPLRVRSILVVPIIFSQAFSHGHHLASWESCPTSWDIPLLSNHSIHSCFIEANVKKGERRKLISASPKKTRLTSQWGVS